MSYRVRYKSQDGCIEIDFTAKDATQAFVKLAECDEFADREPCGMCGSPGVYHDAQRDDEGRYALRLKCYDCGAVLDFGHHKGDGRLFAWRSKAPTTHGWHKEYEQSEQAGEQTAAAERG